MPEIKPNSAVTNKANEISNLAPKLELFGKLFVAQAQRASGDRGRTVLQVMKDLRRRIRETV